MKQWLATCFVGVRIYNVAADFQRSIPTITAIRIEDVMHTRILFSFLSLFLVAIGCQEGKKVDDSDVKPSGLNKVSLVSDQVVEASCGECQFGMPGNGCDLAVRIDGKSYYVDGSSIDDHGDAHDESGMCNCIRKARVTGEIKGDRFAATSFELLPFDKEQAQRDSQEKLKKSRLGASFAKKGSEELFVHDVWEEGPAGKAGLKKGDQVLKINGQPAAELDQDSLKSILGKDSTLVFEVTRDAESLEITVEESVK